MKKMWCLGCTITSRKLMPLVYDNYREAQDVMKDLFKKSQEDFSKLELFDIPELYAIRKTLNKDCYVGLKICEKPLEEVGCGILCTVQAMFKNAESVTREKMEEVTRVAEEKEYYLPGSGLYWHWFNNFCKRATHWYECVEALKCGKPVTMLIKRPGDTRNFFINLLGIKNTSKTSPSDVVFITSDEDNGCEISLSTLMEQSVTAPWIWV